MKILVLEENEHITNIYKKLFAKKELNVEFAKNSIEFFDKVKENFDFFILENPNSLGIPSSKIQDKEREKFINLSSFLEKNENLAHLRKESRDIIAKPFAMVVLLAKLELITVKNTIVIESH